MSRSPVTEKGISQDCLRLVGLVVCAADGQGEDIGSEGRPLLSFAHVHYHIPHCLVPVQYELEVDVHPPMGESKAAVAVEISVVALGFDGGSHGAVVYLLELQGVLGHTLVREAEAAPLPPCALAAPFRTVDVAVAAIDEAVEVGTACGLVADRPILGGFHGARLRVWHSHRTGSALLGRPSVGGADEPVGVSANLGVRHLAVTDGLLQSLAIFIVADPPLLGGQAPARRRGLQLFGRLSPRVSLADEVDDAGIVLEPGTSVRVRATRPLVLKPVPQRLCLEYTADKGGGGEGGCRRCAGSR